MMRRAVFALAVLTATIVWANCDKVFRIYPVSTDWNEFFAGCFEGPVTNPSAFGDLILVLEAQRGEPDDKVLLGGCMRLTQASGRVDNATLSGLVQDDDKRLARLTVTSATGPIYTLLVRRNPAGNMNATTLDLSNEDGAPFTSASSLQPCSTPRSCPLMSIRIPFLPGGGTP